jgi:hypothetical protein
MTTLTTRPSGAEAAAAGAAVPVPHDFPFLSCAGCGFPIPSWDLVGDEFEHWHAGTCDPLDEVDSAEAADRGR